MPSDKAALRAASDAATEELAPRYPHKVRAAVTAGRAGTMSAPDPVSKTLVKRPLSEEDKRHMAAAMGTSTDMLGPDPIHKQTFVKRVLDEEGKLVSPEELERQKKLRASAGSGAPSTPRRLPPGPQQ